VPIKVAIVEDDSRFRESLAVLINAGEFRCVGTYPNAEAALKLMVENWPDVVLMDINLPKMLGIELVARLKQLRPTLRIVMLTAYMDDEQIFDSLKAGASGYLLKKTSPAKILEAVSDVMSGGAPMSNAIAAKVVQYFQQQKISDETKNLTDREREILGHLSRGRQYKEIGELLGISALTVRAHIQNIYEKLHVRSRTEAVLKFLGQTPRKD
jgi:DNA-binding NarL/FixJ family response regulator